MTKPIETVKTRKAENRTKEQIIAELKATIDDNAVKSRGLRYWTAKANALQEERDEYAYGYKEALKTIQRLVAMRRGEPVPKTRRKPLKVRRPVADTR